MEVVTNEKIPKVEGVSDVPKLEPPKDRAFLKRSLIIACVFLILALIILGITFCFQSSSVKLMGERKGWQGVFLTNGQVYFGRIVKEDSRTIVLKDIYYIQVQQLTPEEGKEPQSQLTLIKLGEELHGPTDEMRINRDHILFVEDLKPTSSVVQTIESARQR